MDPTPNPNAIARERILIVDDETASINILVSTLKMEYDLVIAKNGAEALERVAQDRPDLILLDIWMPGTNGVMVCKTLKDDPATRDVPVIFITAMSEEINEAYGLELGAVDYIGKPFNPIVVRARIRTHLELKRHRDRLEQLAEQRAKQLVHADRLATLGVLSASLVHEINNPLAIISCYGSMLAGQVGKSLESIRGAATLDAEQTQSLSLQLQQADEALRHINESVERVVGITRSMREFAYRGSDERRLCQIGQCIGKAMDLARHKVKHTIQLVQQVDPKLPMIYAHPQQLEQVLVNLISNAVDAIGPQNKGTITLRAKTCAHGVQVECEDNGPGIPPEALGRIWEPFFTTKKLDEGTGLGLSISRGIVEEHKGTIQAENRPGGGARFVVTLPLGDPPASATK